MAGDGGGAGMVSFLGSMVQAWGTAKSADAQARTFIAKANESERQAELLNLAAGDARLRGASAAKRALLHGGLVRGHQRVAAGASGLSMGSAAGVLAYSEENARADADTLTNNAYRQAWGMEIQSHTVKAQAALYRQAQSDVAEAGFISILGQVLGGAGQSVNSGDYNLPTYGSTRPSQPAGSGDFGGYAGAAPPTAGYA